jgi:hypothetical protein
VPYGKIDVDRLVHALVVLIAPVQGRLVIGDSDKGTLGAGVAAICEAPDVPECVLAPGGAFGAAMYKRMVEDDARQARSRCGRSRVFSTKDSWPLRRAAPAARRWPATPYALETRGGIVARGTRCCDLEWISADALAGGSSRTFSRARAHGLAPGDVLVDCPMKTQMLGRELPVRLRDGNRGAHGGRTAQRAVFRASPMSSPFRAGCACSQRMNQRRLEEIM